MISEHGEQVSPGFESQQGLSVIFKLMASDNLIVRIQSLKLLAYFFKNLSSKRKTELMEEQGLFSLITERLLLHGKSQVLNISTYNVLYEVMVEKPCTQVVHKQHSDPGMHTVIHNPAIMKVVANLIRHFSNKKPSDVDEEDDDQDDPDVIKMKIVFLSDLVKLFESSKENRRVLLQQSVWQDWLLDMGYLRPKTKEQDKIQQLVFKLLEMLLFHAVKVQWGGWRVWVDTLAIVHSKISLEDRSEYVKNAKLKYAEEKSNSLSTTNGDKNSDSQNANDDDQVERLKNVLEDVRQSREQPESQETENIIKESDLENEKTKSEVEQVTDAVESVKPSEEVSDSQEVETKDKISVNKNSENDKSLEENDQLENEIKDIELHD